MVERRLMRGAHPAPWSGSRAGRTQRGEFGGPVQGRGRGLARDAGIPASGEEGFGGGGQQVQRRDAPLPGGPFGVGPQRRAQPSPRPCQAGATASERRRATEP